MIRTYKRRIFLPVFFVTLFPLWNTSFVMNDVPYITTNDSTAINFVVRATVYHPVIEQTNRNPDITASGKKIDVKNPYAHRWIAISRDLTSHFQFGDTVIITGTNGIYDGQWIVQDLMNKRWRKKIDFLVGKENQLGRFKHVTIVKK